MPSSNSIAHDVCWGGAIAATAVVAPAFRDEELREIHRQFFEIMKEMLEQYDRHLQRRWARLNAQRGDN